MGKMVGNYVVKDKKTAVGTATITFLGYEVPRGCIAKISWMDVTDYTSLTGRLILGIRDQGGNDIYLNVYQCTALELWHSVDITSDIILLPGERPFALVVTPTNGDACYFSCFGTLYSMDEPGAA